MCDWNANKIRVITGHHVNREVSQADGDKGAVVGDDGGKDGAVMRLVEHRSHLNRLGDAHSTGDEDRRSTTHEIKEAVYLDKGRG